MKVGFYGVCETVSRAFARLGHTVVILDSLHGVDKRGLNLLLCSPPGASLCNSGARWLRRPGRRAEIAVTSRRFRECLNAPVTRVVCMHPIMHRVGRLAVGRRQDQVVQPWQFGDGETRALCLWLRQVPSLRATRVVAGRVARVYSLRPSADRVKLRSYITPGLAAAMASQWGACHLGSPYFRRRGL